MIKVPTRFKSLYMHDQLSKLFYVYHGGRGGGKSWEIARYLLIEGARKKHRIICCREVMKSISQSVHKLLSDQIVVLGLTAFYEILQYEIRGKNGTEFSFSGLLAHTVDSVKSFEGATITWIEEAQTISQRSLDILIPTVVRTGKPQIIFSLNPDLPSDPVYKDYVEPDREDTVKISINYYDNPNCPPELIKLAEDMKASDFEKYKNIYLGEAKHIAEGAIYKAEFELIRQQNRICRVPYDPNLPVYTSWDLGILDPTAIWFFQSFGKEIRAIDYYEANGEPLSHYARVLREKNYNFVGGKHFLPHDTAARDLSSGVSRQQTLASLGIVATIGARLGVEERIEASRQMLQVTWFDEQKCKRGIECLQNYRRAFNERLGEFKADPVHDWASHGSDAYGEGALAINKMIAQPQTQHKPLAPIGGGGWMS